MEEHLKHLETQMTDFGMKLDHLYRIIAGEELNEETSIVYRLKEAEKEIKTLQKFKDRIIYIMYGATIPALYGTSKLFETIINLLK